MSHFEGKNWTRVDQEDGTTIVRVFDGTYVGPDSTPVEVFISVQDGWAYGNPEPSMVEEELEPVEDPALLADLVALTAEVDLGADTPTLTEPDPVEPLLPATPELAEAPVETSETTGHTHDGTEDHTH